MGKGEVMLEEYIKETRQKLEEIITKYPRQIPVSVVADYLGAHPDSIRASVENHPVFGIAWRKSGSTRIEHCIAARVFVPWAAKDLLALECEAKLSSNERRN